MQVRRWKTIGSAGLLGVAALCLTSWSVGQNPYITPGTQLVFRQDSNLGAMVGFLVFLVSIVGGLVSSILRQDGRKPRSEAYALGHPPEPSSCTWPQYCWSLFLPLGPSSASATVTAMTFGASVFKT